MWLAVAAGAFIGTESRYGLGLLFPETAGEVPATTLGINVMGSFLLGFLTTWWLGRPQTPFWLRAFLGPGVLGSFTTFSAVTMATVELAGAARPAQWLLYLILSLMLGLTAAAAGLGLGRRTGGRT